MSRILLHSLIICGLTACTSIRIEGADLVKTGSAFAPLYVRPIDSIPVIVVRSKGFGWVPHGEGFTIGYHKELRVMVTNPEACQLLILEPDSGTRGYERLLEALKATGESLCLIKKDAK